MKGLSQFSREQKMGAVFLLLFGALTISLGWLQLHNTLYGPFVLRAGETSAALSYLDDKTKLQQIDTDQDGINDYDELNFYQTSPYLADTDSDGENDKTEIDHGSNPLCVEGQSCAETGEATPTASTSLPVSPLLDSTGDVLQVLNFAADSLKENDSSPASGGGGQALDVEAIASDPVALRKLILQTGKMSEADLANIDDATLLSIAQQLIQEQ